MIILPAAFIAIWIPTISRAESGGVSGAESAGGAIITDVKPEVTVKRSGGTTEAATIGTRLAPGDTVTATDGGSAALLGESGTLIKLQDGDTFTVGQTGDSADATGKSSRLAQVSKNIFGAVKGFFTRDETIVEITQTGGVRTLEDVGPIYPRNSCIRKKLPNFRWNLPENINGPCTIKIHDSGDILWEITCSGTELAYPEGVPKLKTDETYLWEVLAEEDDIQWASEKFYFSLLAPDEEAEVGRAEEEAIATGTQLGSETTTLLLLGKVYEQAGLHHDAVRVLEDLLTRFGESSPVIMKLVALYDHMGMHKKAKEYSERAKDSH